MKIFAAGLGTETNTFSPLVTALDDFEILSPCGADEISAGQGVCQTWARLAASEGHEFVQGVEASAAPSGITTRHAYETLRDRLLEDLNGALPVDVVLLNLHGAMIAEGYLDCEADLLARVRKRVGTGTAIGVELDLHCNLSETKLTHADIVVTYKEYPHVDVHERAIETYHLTVATKTDAILPTLALFDCCMVGMIPTSREPMASFVDAMRDAERRPGILSVSFGHGFQFADTPDVGAKILVISDGDKNLARVVAAELGRRVYRLRTDITFASIALSMEEAFSRGLRATDKPSVLADQSDNVGGGAPGDSTFVLEWLIEAKIENVALAILYDPGAVRLCQKAGKGARLNLRLGGKTGPDSGRPLDLGVEVVGLRSDYKHGLVQRSGKPWYFSAGDVASVRTAGVSIILSSLRCQCVHPSIFTDLGIDPGKQRVLVLKSYQHFHDGFAALAGQIIYMATPGALPSDPRRINYEKFDTSQHYPWFSDPLNEQDNPSADPPPRRHQV